MSFISEQAPELPRSRWSDVYISSFAQLFGQLATTLVMVALILAMQRQERSGLEIAVLIICEALPMVILGKLIGRLVDSVDSRMLIAVAGTGQIVASLALSRTTAYWPIIIGAIALSVVSGVANPARQALLPAMVTREDLPKAIAVGQTAGAAGMMIGPALAGFLVFGIGAPLTLQIAAVGFVATVIAAFLLRTRRGGAPAAAAAQGVEPQTEWTLRQDRLLWSSVWGLAVVVAAISAVNVVLVLFIMRTLHSTEQVYGVVESMWTVGLLAGAWIFSKLVKASTTDVALARRLFTVLGIASAALIAVGGVQQAVWIVPFYLIGGIQNGGLNVLAGTLLGRRAPAEARGRANAAMGMRVNAGALLGYLAGGLLMAVSEPRWIVIGCGVLGVIAALVVAPMVLRTATVSKGETVRYAEAS